MKILLKKGGTIFFGYGIVLGIFIILGKIFLKNWETIGQKSWEIHWALIFLAAGIGVFTILIRYFIYRFILLKIGGKLSIKHNDLFKVFIYSWLARYLPGKVWLPIGKVYFGVKFGIDKEILILSSIFELILSTIGHILLAIISFLIFFRHFYSNYNLFLILSFLGVIIVFLPLQRPVLIFLMNKIGKRLFKNEKSFILISYQDLIKIVGFYSLMTFGISLSFLIFACGISKINPSQYPTIIGSFIVANFFATISFFAPAGLGVKEGILTALMNPLLGLPIAIKVTIISRIFFILLDILTWLLYKINEKIILSR